MGAVALGKHLWPRPWHSLLGDITDQNGEGVISAARVVCFCRVGSGAAELFSSIMKHFKHREKTSFVLVFFCLAHVFWKARWKQGRARRLVSLSAGSGTLMICH